MYSVNLQLYFQRKTYFSIIFHKCFSGNEEAQIKQIIAFKFIYPVLSRCLLKFKQRKFLIQHIAVKGE